MKFVIGVPRSGTSFFSHLLNSVGPVNVHEHLLSLTGFQILKAARDYSEGKRSANQIRHLVRCYDFRPEVPIDCNYAITHILHLIRDPRDNVRSCVNQLDFYGNLFDIPKGESALIKWFVDQNRPWLFQAVKEIHESCPVFDVPHWAQMTQLEKNCVYWAESHRVILKNLAARKNYVQVRLEDFKDNEGLVKDIFNFLELPAPKPEKIQRLLGSIVNSSGDPMWSEFNRIKKELGIPLLPKFSEWSNEDRQTLLKICGPIAKTLGYDLA